MKEQLESITREIEGTNHLLNQTLSEEEDKILKAYYEAENKKKSIELEIREKTKEKHEMSLYFCDGYYNYFFRSYANYNRIYKII